MTFGLLYQECLAHPDVARSRDLSRFHRVRASRHFWYGGRMLLRGDPLSLLLETVPGTGIPAPGTAEIALVLRPDYYHIAPPQFLHPGIEYTYLDAEAPLREVLPQILTPDESPGCFHMYVGTNHGSSKTGRQRLDPSLSLAAQGAFPAWQESTAPFPRQARLHVQPRRSPIVGALYLAAALLGGAGGFFIVQRLVSSG